MLKCEEFLAIAHFEVAPSFLWFTAIQSIEGEERLADLSPQGCFVAAEAVARVPEGLDEMLAVTDFGLPAKLGRSLTPLIIEQCCPLPNEIAKLRMGRQPSAVAINGAGLTTIDGINATGALTVGTAKTPLTGDDLTVQGGSGSLTVVTSGKGQRRRRWTASEKVRKVEAAIGVRCFALRFSRR